jgi:cytochrome P450
MGHDERYYDRPEEFLPERFLENPLGIKKDCADDLGWRANLLFGGGRRVCPGIVFARTALVSVRYGTLHMKLN